VCERGWDGEKARACARIRVTEEERESQRARKRDKQREIATERERERETAKERERERETEKESEREREKEKKRADLLAAHPTAATCTRTAR